MKEVVTLLSISRSLTNTLIIVLCLYSSTVHATTTHAGMNVSGQGSDYIFLYRGNDIALYDQMQAAGPVGWTAVCSSGCVAGSYYTIGAVSYPETGYMYMYTFDADGNVMYPESGSWYTFTDEPYPPPAPTHEYSSSPTAAQQQRMDSALASVNAGGVGDTFEGVIMGNDNDIYIEQAAGISYIGLGILGNNNAVNIKQDMVPGAHAYNETIIIGDTNNLDILQTGSGNKAAFVNITGSGVDADIIQRGTGEHYLDLSISGDDHVASVLQEGSGHHKATVDLDGSQPWNFNLSQSGTTDKTYSLPHNMSDGSSASGTCSAVGGCNLIVNQN